MTDALFKSPPEADVVKLPTAQHPEHKWSDPVSRPAGIYRYAQTERTCDVCRLVKVTVHAPNGFAWREWRRPDSVMQFKDNRTPVCEVVG